ncbi:MBL fold metallo-hydrolase [Magnetospira sp. QH-2]|uniref:MBL fold metallo-hydrolase n=1 Tax=Magnetospira sp. (strain QH-2) TaxID=1288970 RepID=UPI0003E80C9A|nr:MBL fold metallo-hydrolase [Magnetospira sp. QH-2]CCQ71999.1 Conserved exported protein of unknown function [Magnetospira sp. QH-2]
MKRKTKLAAVLGLVGLAGSGLALGLGAEGSTSDQAQGQGAITTSPQWRDGKFVNERPVIESSFLEMLFKWMRGAENTVPRDPLPVMDRVASDFALPPQTGLRITWLGHSTLLVEMENRRILVDPVWSTRASPLRWMGPKRFHRPPLSLADLPEIDAVVISHDHYDHLDQEAVQALGDRVPLYIVPLGVGGHLRTWGVAPQRIIERDWWETFSLGDLSFTATPARHFSGRSLIMADRDKTLWSGWVIAGPKHRIYYSGDTGMFPTFGEIGKRLGPFDAVLMEIGAYNALWPDVHIGPEQAIEARRALGSGLFIPVHWGTFDLALHAWTEPVERLLAAADQAGVPVAVPRPGESIEPAQPPAVTRWWPPVPWQTADQAPLISSGLNPVTRPN